MPPCAPVWITTWPVLVVRFLLPKPGSTSLAKIGPISHRSLNGLYQLIIVGWVKGGGMLWVYENMGNPLSEHSPAYALAQISLSERIEHPPPSESLPLPSGLFCRQLVAPQPLFLLVPSSTDAPWDLAPTPGSLCICCIFGFFRSTSC